MRETVSLGDRVRSKLTGFQGVVVGKCQYIQQCDQVLVKPETLDKDGNIRKGEWLDEPWVEIIKRGVHKPTGTVEEVVGGKRRRINGAPDREHPTGPESPA